MKKFWKILISVCFAIIVAITIKLLFFTDSLKSKDSLSTKMEMVFIEGGEFRMGATEEQDYLADDDEKPTHYVTLKNFYLAKHPVTIGQFSEFVKESGYMTEAETGVAKPGSQVYGSWTSKHGQDKFMQTVNWRYNQYGELRDSTETEHPVLHVTWNDATAFCNWLSQKTGKQYRLPTEAEWEYAARGGKLTNGYVYSGSNIIDEVGWYLDNSADSTHAVGQKLPNELGLFDMSGLIWEWCQDLYGPYSSESQIDPQGVAEGERRVVRGGSIARFQSECRVSNRKSFFPYNRGAGVGFRIACSTK